MFEKLKSGFKGLVTKVTTTELNPKSLQPILADFKMMLAENDVAFPVADQICNELEKRLTGAQVKRLDDRKKIVEENLRQALLEVIHLFGEGFAGDFPYNVPPPYFPWQMMGKDSITIDLIGNPLNNVFEFADIARPIVIH